LPIYGEKNGVFLQTYVVMLLLQNLTAIKDKKRHFLPNFPTEKKFVNLYNGP
jgi:hypothetical protein